MSNCPYCKTSLELKISLTPVKIDQTFKNDLLTTMEQFIDIQASVMPFGGRMVQSLKGYSLKFAQNYLDRLGALPFVIQACTNCDTVINTEMFTNMASAFGPTSSK